MRDLAGHNYFGDAVFGQKLPVARPTGKQALNAAVGERSLNRKRLRQLHFNLVARRNVKAAVHGLLALGPGMEESEHLPASIHGRKQMCDDGRHERFGQVIELRPKQRYVKGASAKIERLLEVTADIPNRVAIFINTGLPVFCASILRPYRQGRCYGPIR